MDKHNDSGLCLVKMPAGEVKLRFGMAANRMIIAKCVEKPGILVNTIFNEYGTAYMMYAGYVNACMTDDVPEILTFTDFYMFAEEIAEREQLQLIADCYSNSRYTKKTVENIAEEEKKKTQTSTGIVSNHSATENSDSGQTSTTGSLGDSST